MRKGSPEHDAEMRRGEEHFMPIENYGVVGNLHTIALVCCKDGSIDHFAFPHFDSPLVFGRLLTRRGGGFFQIAPADGQTKWQAKQVYMPSSNVLVTKFLGSTEGIAQVTDFLPVTTVADPNRSCLTEELIRKAYGSTSATAPNKGPEVQINVKGWPWLVRKVETVRGSIRFRLCCQPAFDYGRQSHTIRDGDCVDCKVFESSALTLHLSAQFDSVKDPMSPIQWRIEEETVTYSTGLTVKLPILHGEFELKEHQTLFFLLRQPDDGEIKAPNVKLLVSLHYDTNVYWRDWIEKCTYKGRWRETVHRSALVLKLMTFAPTGAIIASPTMSLPEQLGREKNWDYRFVWIRDAAFTVYAFLRIGLTEEARAFMSWIEKRCTEAGPSGLRLIYDVRGFHPTVEACVGKASVLASEVTLDHWTGYEDSKPVRIGNLAASQHQLDIYGELIDALYLCDKYVQRISYDFWCIIRDQIIPQVIQHWRDPDHGIWEIRDTPKHHLFSKVMAWVAIDRAVRLCEKRSLPGPVFEWKQLRNQMHEDVMTCGYSKELGVFTQHYESPHLDASNLIMPLVFFLPAEDPRFIRTLEKTLLPPNLGGLTVNHLVFRYHPDCDDQEGTFTICSFWLVEALTRASARHPGFLAEARLMFENILGFANHLGLFSEEIGLDGRALGNFPQAFTHLSLISAAFNLDRVLG